MLKHDPKEIVEFSFMIRNHRPRRFEIEQDIAPEPKTEVRGYKTLKLFKSWFKLMVNRGNPMFGVLKFDSGETWIWQPIFADKHGKRHGGWQLAKKSRYEKQLEQKAKWENFILSTVGLTL